MDKAVVLVSGGMDSAALLFYVKKRLDAGGVYALSLVYGQRHARELEMASWQAAQAGVVEHRVTDLTSLAELTAGASALTDAAIMVPDLADLKPEQLRQPPTYVPHRNLVFLALAAGYAESLGAGDIFYGAQAQDRYGYWDCTDEFVTRLNAVLALNRGRAVTVHAPFAGMTKAQVLKIGLELRVDYGHTWTCYRGERRPCGTCPSCTERRAAFETAGIVDPLGMAQEV
jgi:7-cyano-7-deazaguanine synthase